MCDLTMLLVVLVDHLLASFVHSPPVLAACETALEPLLRVSAVLLGLGLGLGLGL